MLSSLKLLTGKHSEGSPKSESQENILTLVQSKWNPNKYSYGPHNSISTIITTDVHSETNVSEHGHMCTF
jgi:hypothetical protein